jgi:YfiH family protein
VSAIAAADIVLAPTLAKAGLAHAFFTRAGGVSEGVYESLNGGIGSKDRPDAVAENRARMAATIGVDPERFLVPFQCHSPDTIVVEAPWNGPRPRADAIATQTPGLGLGVTGADCGIVLFADPSAGVIGAAHAGWKGALSGVLESCLDAMARLGARPADIIAVLGPTISQSSYEVGPDFVDRFLESAAANQQFFRPAQRSGQTMFDLPGYIGMRLVRAGCVNFSNLGLDTYSDPSRFFSYRRSVHRGEADFGRLIAAIALS